VIAANPDLFAPEASLLRRPPGVDEALGAHRPAAWEDKNGDGRIQYYNSATTNEVLKAKAEAAGWKGNELTVNNDIIVLANPEIAQLPNWVIALVAAGGLAAALSTAAGLLLAISSAVSHDLVKRVFAPDMSEKGELMAGKISMALAIVLAGYLGLNPPGFAAGTVALAFGIGAFVAVPGHHDGHLQQDHHRQGRHRGDDRRHVRHVLLRVRAPRHLLHRRHQLCRADRRAEQLLRPDPGGLRHRGRDGELRGGHPGEQALRRSRAPARAGDGRVRAHPFLLVLIPVAYFWLRRAWRIFVRRDFSEIALKKGQPPADPARYAPYEGLLNLFGGAVLVYVLVAVLGFQALARDDWMAIAGVTLWLKILASFAISRHAHGIGTGHKKGSGAR
jgi:hypothetical protein